MEHRRHSTVMAGLHGCITDYRETYRTNHFGMCGPEMEYVYTCVTEIDTIIMILYKSLYISS